MSSAAPLSTRRKAVALLVLGFLPVLLLECLLRVGKTLETDLTPDERWFVYSDELGWERRPGYRGQAIEGYREFDQNGYVAVDGLQLESGPADRIVVVGDSVALGLGVGTPETFAEQLDEMLPSHAVINLGVNGYSSLQTAMTLERAITELKPTIAVVSCNFNDRRYVLGPDRSDGPASYRRARVRRPWYTSLYLYRAIHKLIGPEAPKPRPVVLDELPARVGREAYRENLVRMARAAEEGSVRLIFLAMHDNPTETLDLRAGLAQLDAGEQAEGLRLLQRSIDAQDWFSDLGRLHLARALRGTGRGSKADALLVVEAPLDSTHGGLPIVLDREYCSIIREVAARTGAEFIDVGSALDETPGVYTDFCHLDANGNRTVAELIFERIAE